MAGDLPIRIGIVMEAHAVRQLYRVQLGSSVRPVWAVPAGTRSVAGDLASTAQTYAVGDLVIVCGDRLSPLNENGADALYYAIILCAVPHSVTGLEEGVKKASEDTIDAKYEAADIEAYEHTDPIKTRGFNTSERSCVRLGEAALRSKHASVVVAGRKASISAGSAELSVSDIGDHWKFTGISMKCDFSGYREAFKIVNDTYLHTNGNYALTGSVFPFFVEQSGELPYGNIRSIINKDGVPLSNIEQRGDGSVVIQAASGISLERKLAVDPVYVDDYVSGVCADSGVENSNFGTEFEYCEPFARVTNSEHWQSLNGQEASEGFLRTQEPPKKIETTPVKDINGNNAKPVSGVESVVRQLSDGSIVIRDAWGSEIRMYNGDIQLYAAKKLVFISDSDNLTMCGGVYSLSAGAVNAVTQFGNVDIAAATEVNIASATNVNISGEETACVITDGVLTIAAKNSILDATNMSLSARELLDIQATSICAGAEVSCTVCAGKNAVADFNAAGEIAIAAGRTTAYTTLTITDATYKAGKVADVETNAISGSGVLFVRGDCLINRSLAAKENIISSTGRIAGMSVCAVNVAPEVGVFGLRRGDMPKISVDKSDAQRSATDKSGALAALRKAVSGLAISDVLYGLFSCIPKAISVILPKQCRNKAGSSPISNGSYRVASDGSERYIYPGKSFWEGDIVYSADETTDEVIPAERTKINKILTTVKESDYV